MAYDPAGPGFLAALDNGSIQAFDATNPKVAPTTLGGTPPMKAAKVLAILGKSAAAGYAGGLILYWADVTKPPDAIQFPSDVTALAFASATRLISGHADGVARRWDLGNTAALAPSARPLDVTLPFALDPDTNRVAGLKDGAHKNQVTLYQADGTTAAMPIDASGDVKALVLAGDAMVVSVAGTSVNLYKASAPGAPKKVPLMPRTAVAIAATPDGKTVLVDEDDGSLVSIDVASAAPTPATLKFTGTVVKLRAATSADGTLAAAVMDDGSAGIGRLGDTTATALHGSTGPKAVTIAVSGSAKSCAVGYADGTIDVFKITSMPFAVTKPGLQRRLKLPGRGPWRGWRTCRWTTAKSAMRPQRDAAYAERCCAGRRPRDLAGRARGGPPDDPAGGRRGPRGREGRRQERDGPGREARRQFGVAALTKGTSQRPGLANGQTPAIRAE